MNGTSEEEGAADDSYPADGPLQSGTMSLRRVKPKSKVSIWKALVKLESLQVTTLNNCLATAAMHPATSSIAHVSRAAQCTVGWAWVWGAFLVSVPTFHCGLQAIK